MCRHFDVKSPTLLNWISHNVPENFGFHNEYDDEYEKVFIIFWILQASFCNSVEWLLGPCSKKVAEVYHK